MRQIMHANAIARRDMCNVSTNLLDPTSYFVSERHRKILNLGNARAIMRIGVTDSRSSDANQNVRRSDLGNWNVRRLERFCDLDESHRSHFLAIVTRVDAIKTSCSPNQSVEISLLQTSAAIMFPGQFEKSEPILVRCELTIGGLVQVDEAARDNEHSDHRLW